MPSLSVRVSRPAPWAALALLLASNLLAAGCSQAPKPVAAGQPAPDSPADGPSKGEPTADDGTEPEGLSEEELVEFRRKHPQAAAALEVSERRRKLALAQLGEEYVPFKKGPNEPADGNWLVDDEGREYWVEQVRKYEGKYQMITEERVNLYGVKVDIVGHDDEWFYLKLYRDSGEPINFEYVPPTEEELAAVDATYAPPDTAADELRFEPFDDGLPTAGQWRNGFDVADMNEDGHLDIVHSPPRKGGETPVILLGDSAGRWTQWRDVRFESGYDYGDATVADFNGDGHLDIALGIHLRGVRVMVGNGRGAFLEWSDGIDYQVPGRGGDGSGFSSRRVMPVDWDGDGDLDLLALGEGPRVGSPQGLRDPSRAGRALRTLFVADGPAIFLNQSDGTWVKEQKAVGPYEMFGDDLALGDFNGDGRIDFATSSSRMARRDLVNLRPEEGVSWEPVKLKELRPFAFVRAVAAGDFDGDGIDDLALSYSAYEADLWRSGIDVLYFSADGETERRVLYSRPGRLAIYGLTTGDLNGDGVTDLFGVDGDGDSFAFLGDGEGFFRRELTPEMDKPRGRCRGYHVELVDLDGDGRDEVIANYADESSAYFDADRCLGGGGIMAWKLAQ